MICQDNRLPLDPAYVTTLLARVSGVGRAAGAAPRLFSYTTEPKFVGEIFKANTAGRAWATVHPPGPWAFEGGVANMLRRMWRTGQYKPFLDVIEIPGPARKLFVPANAIGAFRGWKQLSGQYFSRRPGNVDLSITRGTPDILKPTWWQFLRFGADSIFSHFFDATTTGIIFYFILDEEGAK